mmetsp:Transcript_17758/g.41510  ORF Transcript_17758/g.41510 Transcript_17758/m.41510 type:complete len:89 (-) Transcript_17758:162-428(-)
MSQSEQLQKAIAFEAIHSKPPSYWNPSSSIGMTRKLRRMKRRLLLEAVGTKDAGSRRKSTSSSSLEDSFTSTDESIESTLVQETGHSK